jgi:hypothetical protein
VRGAARTGAAGAHGVLRTGRVETFLANMSLARNDMLTTGDNRAPRARRSCYVDEPAFGFFVAGSTHKQLNGLYIRRNLPNPCPREHGIMLYYEHMDSGWTMLLADCEAKPPASAWGYERSAENGWFFVDPRAADRFTHPGETIVPGAGVRWKHVHRSGGAQAGRAASGHGSSQLAKAEADDEDELPWQVIAILDNDILRQLAGGAEYHKQRVAEAVAGRGVVKPAALTSLEGCYLPGSWVYRVEVEGGVPVLSSPGGPPWGRRECGDYVRGAELHSGGRWLRLEPAAQSLRPAYSQVRHKEDPKPNPSPLP